MNIRRVLALMAMMLGSIAISAGSAYAQECDPSWYNPWASSNAAVARTEAPKAAHQHQQKMKNASGTQHAKVRVKSAQKSS